VVHLRSSPSLLPDVMIHAFSVTITTLALNQRSLRWFEACSCKAASEDLPPSLMQHRACFSSCAFSAHIRQQYRNCGRSISSAEYTPTVETSFSTYTKY
jgi:hypothetical protein